LVSWFSPIGITLRIMTRIQTDDHLKALTMDRLDALDFPRIVDGMMAEAVEMSERAEAFTFPDVKYLMVPRINQAIDIKSPGNRCRLSVNIHERGLLCGQLTRLPSTLQVTSCLSLGEVVHRVAGSVQRCQAFFEQKRGGGEVSVAGVSPIPSRLRPSEGATNLPCWPLA
jgi:hypothetical protein